MTNWKTYDYCQCGTVGDAYAIAQEVIEVIRSRAKEGAKGGHACPAFTGQIAAFVKLAFSEEMFQWVRASMPYEGTVASMDKFESNMFKAYCEFTGQPQPEPTFKVQEFGSLEDLLNALFKPKKDDKPKH